jgi:drug/metabolite transporter (DMT)-like permease
MGLAFLPWERLPSWLLGPLVAAVGVFLILNAEPFSWRQLEAVAFIVIGVAMAIRGVKKLFSKPVENVGDNDR